jgi:hypothetical protein
MYGKPLAVNGAISMLHIDGTHVRLRCQDMEGKRCSTLGGLSVCIPKGNVMGFKKGASASRKDQ